MKKPLGVIFDIGDTVVEHVTNNPLEGMKKILEFSDNPHNVSLEEIQARANKIISHTFNKRDETDLEINYQSFLRLLFEYFDIQFRLPIEEIEKIYNQATYKTRPSEGIKELFSTLDTLKIKYAALSNSAFSKETLIDELEHNQINPNFTFIMSSCDYCLRKPHPLLFELASQKIGLNPTDIWFIGDTYQFDIVGAHKAGMIPVWYNKKNIKIANPIECIEVKSFQEIIELLKK